MSHVLKIIREILTVPSYKAYLGAIIGILAFAIGPFVQETVNYVEMSGQTALSRCEATNSFGAEMFNIFHGLVASDVVHLGGPYDMYLQELNTDCPTGNCTYPVFTSLGVCSSCVDMGSKTTQHCVGDQCTITLHLDLEDLQNLTISGYASHDGINIQMGTSDTSPKYVEHGASSIIDSYILRYIADGSALASECLMYWCVRAYNASVNANVLEEDIVAAWYGRDSMDSETGIVFSPPKDQWAALNLTKPTNFTVDDDTSGMVEEFLYTALTGTAYINGTSTSQDWVITEFFANLFPAPAASQNMTFMFEAIATAMSNGYRQACPANISAHGTMFDIHTILEVQWVYLVYPAAIIALTLLFTVLVIWESRKDAAIVWKDKVLPFVYHGLTPDVDDTVLKECGDDVDAMERHAKKMKVKLQRVEGGGWHLAEYKQV